ncbi:MAG: 3D domain-containing protein [Acidobacteria bacterium]|nr:3D domain-containing protein [Acidobacteriota bacterium]
MCIKELSDVRGRKGRSPVNFVMLLIGSVCAWHLMALDQHKLFEAKNLEPRVEDEIELIIAPDCPEPLEALSEPIDFQATAYCEAGITRSGQPTAPGVAAADPTVLPLGSLVLVENESYRAVLRVLDTGRLVKGRIIDIFMTDYSDAIRFGRQPVKLTVIHYAGMPSGLTEDAD